MLRLVTAMLREDVAGLRSRAVLRPDPGIAVAGHHRTPAGCRPGDPSGSAWLALNGLRIPVRVGSVNRGDLLDDLVMARPVILRVRPGRHPVLVRLVRLGPVTAVLGAELVVGLPAERAAEWHAGFRALLTEGLAAAGAAQLRHRRRAEVLGRLRRESDPDRWPVQLSRGSVGPDERRATDDRPTPADRESTRAESEDGDVWLTAESLAAHRDHPVYPLSIARVGLRTADLRLWAPEHAPRFHLRWVAVPQEQVVAEGELPGWWPGSFCAGQDSGERMRSGPDPSVGAGPGDEESGSVGICRAGGTTGRGGAQQRACGPVGAPGGGWPTGRDVDATGRIGSVGEVSGGGRTGREPGSGQVGAADGPGGPVGSSETSWWGSVPPGHVVIPVHPAMPLDELERSVPGGGLRLLPGPGPWVRPTLSMRTVAVEGDRTVHLKVPLPMRTLGRKNLRLISRAALSDGAVLTRGLRRLLDRDEQFHGTVLAADESTWVHVGDRLAVLVRRWPPLGQARVVPVAGLTARRWDGRLLIDVLAEEFFAGDLDALLDRYLRTLLDWQIGLWLRYGIVHEAHPQNVLVALDRPGGAPRLRLLIRDLDSCLVDPVVAASALGVDAPTRLTDQRLIAHDPAELVAMFITTTLHQCVAAVLVETALGTGRPVTGMLARIRPLLDEAASRYRETRDVTRLVAEVIRAERLPVKRTLTAATLLPKTRTGAADVNKFYGAEAGSYL